MSTSRKANPYRLEEQRPEEQESETNAFIETKEIEGSVVCPDCGVRGPGIVTSEVPLFIFVLNILMLFVIGKWAFLVTPFLFLLVQSQIRTCTSCGHIIEQKLQFSVKAVNESVFTLKFSGDLVVVISKRYAMIAGSLLLLLLLSVFTYEEFFSTATSLTMSKYQKERKDFAGWSQYLEDCGSLRLKANEYRTDNVFSGKYRGTNVEWSGVFLQKSGVSIRGRVMEGFKVKMDPTDSEEEDVFLDLTDSPATLAAGSSLEEGDFFTFKGTLAAIGNEEYPHVVLAIELSKPVKRLSASEIKQIKFYEFQKTGRMFGK